jgi:hypothetical protein
MGVVDKWDFSRHPESLFHNLAEADEHKPPTPNSPG